MVYLFHTNIADVAVGWTRRPVDETFIAKPQINMMRFYWKRVIPLDSTRCQCLLYLSSCERNDGSLLLIVIQQYFRYDARINKRNDQLSNRTYTVNDCSNSYDPITHRLPRKCKVQDHSDLEQCEHSKVLAGLRDEGSPAVIEVCIWDLVF